MSALKGGISDWHRHGEGMLWQGGTSFKSCLLQSGVSVKKRITSIQVVPRPCFAKRCAYWFDQLPNNCSGNSK